MDPEHSASLPSSLPYGRSTVDSTKILISHKDKDSLCHTNISSGDVTVEEYNTGKPEPCSVSGRRGSAGQAHNIPYMQHFHHLKQKFPDLRDCDINESIQKYGLDLARCEAELQRAQSHSSGYYGPWGRGHLSSRSSPTTTPTRNASLTSPNTPTLSPYSSPFSSQVLPSPLTMASSRSTPKLFSPKTSSNTPGSKETISVPQCSPSTCCAPSSLATPSPVAYASSLMPSLATTAGPAVYPPSSILTVASNSYNSHNSYENQNLFTSPIHNGSSLARVPSSQADPYHTAITRHYIGTSVYHNTNDPFCRQYSNSSETITEESSIMGSNIPSPAPTLTFSSPQSPLVSPPVHNHCADMPDLSRLLEQLPISQSASNQQQFRQPINPFLPPWNQGNEQTSNRPTLSNAQMPPYVDNDTPYNPTREQTARSARSTSSANRENNPAAVYFSRPPERSNSGDKLAADPSEVRRRRPNFQSPLEPVRIAPPPPVLASGNIGPAHQISRLTDLQLCTVPPSSSSPCVPPPLPPSSSTAAGLNQTPPAKIDNRKGLLEDQRARQQRMLAVLTEGTRDRTCLQEEVTKLSLSLEESRQKGIADASRSAKIIHDIQEENRRLQSECDRMEGDILETDEAPDLVETGYGASFSNPREGPSYSLSSPSSPLPARPQQLNRGVSVGRGVGEGAQRFTPTRVAPPPPVSSGYTAATSSAPPQFPSGGYDPPMQQQAGGSSTARWSCNRCTYDNHPDMTACEICGAMRMPPSPHTPAGGFSRPSLGPTMQDIHIQVRHRHGYATPAPALSELSSQADPL